MLLQVKRSEIRDGSTVNVGATIMGGAVVGPGTTLMASSLVLKGMRLPEASYEGSPAEPLRAGRIGCELR
jgi:acetyltransferase-like isoleucine patch superfamily enzyme